MTQISAKLNNYRQSPRKVRLVADALRGKKAVDAIVTLSFMPKRASKPLQKLLSSAVQNGKNIGLPTENLVVKELTVDNGPILYRRQPRSRGMANPIRKRTSHVKVILSEGKMVKDDSKSKKDKNIKKVK